MDNIQVVAINGVRESITDCIDEVRGIVEGSKPPAVQEATLALRHLEDARMRLGLARTYLEGKDPFERK